MTCVRLVCILVWALSACSTASTAPTDAGSDAGSDAGADAGSDAGFGPGGDGGLAATLAILGDPDAGLGIFDPSVWYPSDADAGAMVYSVVAPDQNGVHTRIALSDDEGRSWRFAAEVNQASAVSISTNDVAVCGQATCAGTLVHEVASLVIDPGDTPERRYQVFGHTYFTNTSAGGVVGLHPDIGVLSLFTAGAPAGPWTETRLLGWSGTSAFSSDRVSQDASTDPSLAGLRHCVALTEPGALLRRQGSATVLDLALGCVFLANGGPQVEIDLIRSTDHGRTFHFVSTLLAADDALALGYPTPLLNAPDLFEWAGQTWLFATPTGTARLPGGGTSGGYRGCLVFAMADLDAGTLQRNAGVPVVRASWTGAAEQFVGACTVAEGARMMGVAGDVLAQSPPLFGIFNTGPR